MDDLIYRQAALDALGEGAMVNYQAAGHDNGLIKAIGVIKGLPAAQRKGKWIIVTDSRGRHAECPYCGEWEYHSNQKFCGECGARMEENR